MKIKAVVIDDEKEAVKTIENISKKYCNYIEIQGFAHNIKDAVELIQLNQPDLVFLDIILEPTNEKGFELFSHFAKINFEVIFTTAHNDYAIKAIKYSALDYLLKPIDIEDFKNAVAKMIERKKITFNQQKIELLLEIIKSNSSDFSKIALPTRTGYDFVNVNDIIKCKADGSYTNIFFLDGSSMLVSKTLKEIDNLLPESKFFRIHKSVTINFHYIKKIDTTEGNNVILIDGSTEPLSLRNKPGFLEKLNNLKI